MDDAGTATALKKFEPAARPLPKVLWVDADAESADSARRILASEPTQFVAAKSVEQARALLADGGYAAIVVSEFLGDASGVELLAHAKLARPNASRVLLAGRIDGDTLEAAVNRGGVFRFVSKPWSDAELKLDVRRAIEHHERAEAQATLLREASVQNRKLAELASGLETIVGERTSGVERSKEEAESKQARTRDLVRFIKELAGLVSVEELMELLRGELKSFHELRPPALGYMLAERMPRIAYFQGKQALEKEARSSWPPSQRLRVNELEDRAYLANEFGRPFVKTLAIPLKRRASAPAGGESPATLFFEHALAEDRVEAFLQFIGERAQPLAIALDRILLEHNLKTAASQWASTFDGVRDPIAIIDVDYRVVRGNRDFGSAFGLEWNGARGSYRRESRCHKVFASIESPCRGCPAAKALETGLPQRAQIRRGNRVFEARSYPIRLAGDTRATNVINHYVDVTAARDLHGRLIQNEKMAAVGLLAGNIAHELNNPLTGIRSLAQALIAEMPDEATAKADMIEVEKAAQRSSKIIENLLDFTATGARAGVARTGVAIVLDEIVRRTLPMLKTALREHRVALRLEAGERALVRVEPNLMQQVVFNLVNNACQAMVDAGEVAIETEARDGEGAAVLRVRDAGPGVPPELVDSIFEPFFTTKSEGQGTGLGLSVVRQTVERFGGAVTVESEPGHGAEFTVRLPLFAAEAP